MLNKLMSMSSKVSQIDQRHIKVAVALMALALLALGAGAPGAYTGY